MRYVNNYLRPTENYPANPNGSPCGIAGVLNPPNPPHPVLLWSTQHLSGMLLSC